MAQHLWCESANMRICEACFKAQFIRSGDWAPAVSSICPGDPEDDGRRVTRRRPLAPSGAPRIMVLEDA
jgi:hypothetical protein